MFKKVSLIVAVLMLVSMVLSACTPAAPAAPAVTEKKLKICQVTDTGGIDDKGFNQTAWKGVEDAKKAFGVEGKFLESQQQTDYEKNINAFIEEKCDLIVTVGFLLGDATKLAAEANPTQKFGIIDFAYDPVIPNVVGMVFSVDQPSYLAGYLAAGMSKTGKIGTYGGIQIPVLEPFMTGYVLGAQAYNAKHGTKVEVLGWDPTSKTGLFTGNFESTDDGRRMAESLMDEGADVIFPVAGPCGLGSAAAIKERSGAMMIGVDTDMVVSAPEYQDVLVTSVLKNMDKAVFDVTQQVKDGKFAGGLFVGTATNGGVGLAPYHMFEDKVPAALKAEIDALAKDIADGKVKTMP
jgi:basic membrane protein A